MQRYLRQTHCKRYHCFQTIFRFFFCVGGATALFSDEVDCLVAKISSSSASLFFVFGSSKSRTFGFSATISFLTLKMSSSSTIELFLGIVTIELALFDPPVAFVVACFAVVACVVGAKVVACVVSATVVACVGGAVVEADVVVAAEGPVGFGTGAFEEVSLESVAAISAFFPYI